MESSPAQMLCLLVGTFLMFPVLYELFLPTRAGNLHLCSGRTNLKLPYGVLYLFLSCILPLQQWLSNSF